MAEFPLKDLISEVDEKRAMHVQLTGSYVKELINDTAVTITAGSSYTTASISVATQDEVVVFVRPINTHNYQARVGNFTEDNIGLEANSTAMPIAIAAASQARKASDRIKTLSRKMVVRVENNDVADQTYQNIMLIGFGGRVQA